MQRWVNNSFNITTPFKLLVLSALIASCSEPKQEISNDLYGKALLYLVFEDGPISQFYQNAGCVQIDSSRFYFGEDHYAFSEFWNGGSIYRKGDTIGFFGGSCIFRTEVYILDKNLDQIIVFEARNFYMDSHKKNSDEFKAQQLTSFTPSDTLGVFNLVVSKGELRVIETEDKRPILTIQPTTRGETVKNFIYSKNEENTKPSSIFQTTGDSLVIVKDYSGYKREMLLSRLDHSYSLTEFRDSITPNPTILGKVIIDKNCL